jgi:hypothetical protein
MKNFPRLFVKYFCTKSSISGAASEFIGKTAMVHQFEGYFPLDL